MNKLYSDASLLATNAVWSDEQQGWLIDDGKIALHDPQRNYTLKVIPDTVTPRQAKTALLAAGLLSTVETLMESQSREVQLKWTEAVEFVRSDPVFEALKVALGLTTEEIDDLFIAAGEIE